MATTIETKKRKECAEVGCAISPSFSYYKEASRGGKFCYARRHESKFPPALPLKEEAPSVNSQPAITCMLWLWDLPHCSKSSCCLGTRRCNYALYPALKTLDIAGAPMTMCCGLQSRAYMTNMSFSEE